MIPVPGIRSNDKIVEVRNVSRPAPTPNAVRIK